MAKEKEINVAVVGCGYWGPNLVRNFAQISKVNLHSCCDISREKLEPIKKTYPSVKITTNYKELLENPAIDAVAIATPVATHFELAKEALMHNKHVFVEKPITVSSKEASELIALSKEKGKILMVDHVYEYAQAINKIKEIIKKGELGDIYYVRAEWLNLGILQPDINVVWDLATHIFSILLYVLDLEPVSLSAKAGAYLRRNIEEVASLTLKFPKNIAAYITISWLEPNKVRRIVIVGSKKMLIYDLLNENEQVKVYNKGVEVLPTEYDDVRQFKINYRYGDIYSPYLKSIEPLKEACSHFIDCIKENKKPRSDGEVGLAVIKILEATKNSIKNDGKEIKLI